MDCLIRRARGGDHGRCELEVGHGWIAEWNVAGGGAFVANSRCCDHKVRKMHALLDRPGGADADERRRPDGRQLFDSDGGRRRADSRGADGDQPTGKLSSVGGELAVSRDQPRAVELLGDRLHPTWVTWEEDDVADVARFAAD